ncbi:MAG: spore cortex-lytic enzyme [Acutalibacteraceae bacterium]
MKQLKIIISLILVLCMFCLCASALSKYGSRSAEVTEIQTRLKKWGYYKGEIDGIFGSKTKKAVIEFQKKNGLVPDGIAGPKTLAAMGISSGKDGKNSSSDYQLLVRIISAEARGEPYLGQVAVGAVVLNRVEHPSFPDTIAGVIYQKGAFTCLDDGQFYEPIQESAYKAATDALNGLDPSGGAVYYYNPAKSTNKWMLSRPVLTTIGRHRFCS